jgi:4-amino-4-deoxy-L-arabinose transferase-like glycosyltransferase
MFHVINMWMWLSANVVLTRWDSPQLLVKSLVFNDLLQNLSLTSLFDVMIWDTYKPPLLPLSAVPLYRLFGLSSDVAVMVNVFYMGILIAAVYGIGKHLYGRRVGLLAAFLVSIFPMTSAMSRYFYMDFALMAMVALSVYLLLRTEGFAHRGYSLLFGFSLGLGMLTKWAFPAFVAPPLLVVLISSPIWRDLRQRAWPPRVDLRWILIAGVVGLLASLLGYLPNREQVAGLLLGQWLLALSWLLVAATVYVLSRRPSRSINLLSALMLGMLVASVWYLPGVEFIRKVILTLYFGWSSASDSIEVLHFQTYVYYLDKLATEQMSLPLFVGFILAGGILVWKTLRGLPWPGGLKRIKAGGWILTLWIAVPYVILTFATYRDSRAIMPVLPAVAVIMARGLLAIQSRLTKGTLIALIGIFCLVQFTVLSFDAFAEVPSRLSADLPFVGHVGLFAKGTQIQWPDSGDTDSDFWIIPDLFEVIARERPQAEKGEIQFRFLNGNRQINEYTIGYLIRTEYPQLSPNECAVRRQGTPFYPQLFRCDYIAIRKSVLGFPLPDRDQLQQAIQFILEDKPPSFEDTFQLIKTYTLPDGDTVYFYRNAFHRVPRRFSEVLLSALDRIQQVNFGDKILLLGYNMSVEERELRLGLHWLCREPIDEDYIVYLKLVNGVYHLFGQQEGRPHWDSLPTHTWTKGQLIADERVLEVLPGTPPGFYQVELILLDAHRGTVLETGDREPLLLGPLEIPRRESPAVESLGIQHPLDANLDEKVRLLGYNIESGFRAGDNIHLTLFWQCLEEMGQSYTVFTHLVDAGDNTVAQKDNPPVDGFYPTTKWEVGEIVRDQYDMVIPSDAPPGEYRLNVGMYLAETGERLNVLKDGVPLPDNWILLQSVAVGGAE